MTNELSSRYDKFIPFKRILVTGASGFIGFNILPFLKNNGYEVWAASRNGWLSCDLSKEEEIRKIMERIKPTYLLHLAWDVSDGYVNSTNNFNWLIYSQILLKWFAKCGGKRVVIAGTCVDKTSSYYGVCKRLLNITAKEFAELTDISYTYGRIFYLYGEKERKNRLIPYIITSLLNKEPIIIKNKRLDLLYVKDVAGALLSLLNSDAQGDVDIGSGKLISIGTIVEQIEKLMEIKSQNKKELNIIPEVEYVANITRINSEAGWYPKYTLEQGLQESIIYWKTQQEKKE